MFVVLDDAPIIPPVDDDDGPPVDEDAPTDAQIAHGAECIWGDGTTGHHL